MTDSGDFDFFTSAAPCEGAVTEPSVDMFGFGEWDTTANDEEQQESTCFLKNAAGVDPACGVETAADFGFDWAGSVVSEDVAASSSADDAAAPDTISGGAMPPPSPLPPRAMTAAAPKSTVPRPSNAAATTSSPQSGSTEAHRGQKKTLHQSAAPSVAMSKSLLAEMDGVLQDVAAGAPPPLCMTDAEFRTTVASIAAKAAEESELLLQCGADVAKAAVACLSTLGPCPALAALWRSSDGTALVPEGVPLVHLLETLRPRFASEQRRLAAYLTATGAVAVRRSLVS